MAYICCYKIVKIMKFKKGDKVKLPFNETGTVVKVRDYIWMFNRSTSAAILYSTC
jgi:hypothetical protein